MQGKLSGLSEKFNKSIGQRLKGVYRWEQLGW